MISFLTGKSIASSNRLGTHGTGNGHQINYQVFIFLLIAALGAGATAGRVRPAADILAEYKTAQEDLADQQRQLNQLGEGLEGLDDIEVTPPPVQANTPTKDLRDPKAWTQYRGQVTLTGYNLITNPTAKRDWDPQPATLMVAESPEGVWHFAVSCDVMVLPSTLHTTWKNLSAAGGSLVLRRSEALADEALVIERRGDSLSGTCTQTYKNPYEGGVVTGSATYSFHGTLIQP